MRIKKSIKNWLVGSWWWLVGGGWWCLVVVGDSCLVWGTIVFTQDLSLQLLAQARMACWICWRIRPRSQKLKGWKMVEALLMKTRFIKVCDDSRCNIWWIWWFWLCVILRLQHLLAKSLGLRNWEFYHAIWFQHWRLQARPSPSWRRSWQCPRPPKWLRRCQWMRFQRKAPREGRNWPAEVMETTEIMAILLLESWFWSWYIMYIYIYNIKLLNGCKRWLLTDGVVMSHELEHVWSVSRTGCMPGVKRAATLTLDMGDDLAMDTGHHTTFSRRMVNALLQLLSKPSLSLVFLPGEIGDDENEAVLHLKDSR